MYKFIKEFPKQLAEAIILGQQAKLTPATKPIHHVLVSGMGGSGIGGTLVKQWVADLLPIPMEVNHTYTLPAYVNENTLLVIVTYSGNTEETLHTLEAGIQKQAQIVCITSGGAAKRLAEQHGINLIPLPADRPPRACLDHTTVQLLFVLRFYQLIAWDFVAEIQEAIQLLRQTQRSLQTEAQQIAMHIQGKYPVIYTTAAYEAVAIRLRQQLNENSKQLCWHHVIPEMSHNEIVGWSSAHKHLAVFMLGSHTEPARIQLQQHIAQAIIQKHAPSFITLQAQGRTYFIQSLYLIHLGDWLSFYLAQGKKVDPMEIAAIDQVKAGLNQCH